MGSTALPRKLAGRYEIRKVPGEGGMGLVYRAYDSIIRREVAVRPYNTFQSRRKVLDPVVMPGVNPSSGKFGFLIPGSDELALSNFRHYAEAGAR